MVGGGVGADETSIQVGDDVAAVEAAVSHSTGASVPSDAAAGSSMLAQFGATVVLAVGARPASAPTATVGAGDPSEPLADAVGSSARSQ